MNRSNVLKDVWLRTEIIRHNSWSSSLKYQAANSQLCQACLLFTTNFVLVLLIKRYPRFEHHFEVQKILERLLDHGVQCDAFEVDSGGNCKIGTIK